MLRVYRAGLVAVACLSLVSPALAQTNGTTNNEPVEIDECGTLTQSGSCVVFATNGGNYVLSDYGNFRAGDNVRVVGTADPTCVQICPDADGCVRGATLYDPAQFPCGTAIPSLGEDLIPALTESACAALSGSIGMLTVAGLLFTRRREWRTSAPSR